MFQGSVKAQALQLKKCILPNYIKPRAAAEDALPSSISHKRQHTKPPTCEVGLRSTGSCVSTSTLHLACSRTSTFQTRIASRISHTLGPCLCNDSLLPRVTASMPLSTNNLASPTSNADLPNITSPKRSSRTPQRKPWQRRPQARGNSPPLRSQNPYR